MLVWYTHFPKFRLQNNLLFHISVEQISTIKLKLYETIKTMLKLLFFLLVCCHVQSLPYHYAKNRQRIARGTNSRLSPSISYGLNEAALSKYQAGNQVRSFISFCDNLFLLISIERAIMIQMCFSLVTQKALSYEKRARKNVDEIDHFFRMLTRRCQNLKVLE